MRIFMTGASGFLGRSIAPRLRADGHIVTALLLPGEQADGVPAAHVVRGDITQAGSFDGAMRDHDAVVHLAGAVGYGQTFDRCRRLNRDGTANVAREAVKSGVRRFIHMSSVSVYGRVAEVPLTEDAPMRRIGDPYGDTKADAEEIVGAHARSGELDVTILRPTVIWGPGDALFLPKLIENLRSGKVRIVGPGTNTVDAVHVYDVAEIVARALANSRAVGRTYNVNHPANPTWREWVTRVSASLGVPAPTGHLPYPVALAVAAVLEGVAALTGEPARLTRYSVRVIGRQYHYVVDRARDELGFTAQVTLAPPAVST